MIEYATRIVIEHSDFIFGMIVWIITLLCMYYAGFYDGSEWQKNKQQLDPEDHLTEEDLPIR